MPDKIISLRELAQKIDELKKEHQLVVHCHGVFDLVHPGHLKHFEDAKKLGNVLIVTISPDQYVNKGPGRPVFNQNLRLKHLSALEMIDYVAVNDSPSAVQTILCLKPDIYVKGKEYINLEDLTGNVLREKEAIESVGGKIYFIGDTIYSSTQLLNSYFNVLSPQAEERLKSLRKIYSVDQVISQIRELSSLSVAIIGEVIIDEYYFCRPLGLANKSVTVNAQHLESESHLGGAGAIANHVAGFCENVHLISSLGNQNDYYNDIKRLLSPNISSKFFIRDQTPTVVKRRFLDPSYNRLFELSFLNNRISTRIEELEIVDYLKSMIDKFDVLIVADYGHGFISTPTVVEAISSTRSYLAISTQTNSSNRGFNLATKYHRADYLCLDQSELKLATGVQNQSIEKLMEKFAKEINCDVMSITEGDKGSTTWEKKNVFYKSPALTSETIDATGAGDAYFAMTSICAGSGFSPDLVSFIGNCAGAMLVRILGNQTSVKRIEMEKFITALLK